jgi:hypothetical protein
MQREIPYPNLASASHSAIYGFGNVVELEVEERITPQFVRQTGRSRAFTHEQF